MYFLLFLTFNGVKFNSYGPFVQGVDYDERVVCFRLNDNDVKLLLEDIYEIDMECNALLDNGDVDYFDVSKCGLLLNWINKRIRKPTIPRYHELLETLRDFCQRAIDLNTGVKIEL